MTIAACYISPEGVVLGADSTTTYSGDTAPHHYNNSQKLFEIGEGSTCAVVTWGLGGVSFNSYRRLFARLADDLKSHPPAAFDEIANRWIDLFWPEYVGSTLLQDFLVLHAKPPFDPAAATPNPAARTKEEEERHTWGLSNLGVGFCIAGYVTPDRSPAGYEIIFNPTQPKPAPIALTLGFKFWGAPNMIRRLVFGYDERIPGVITSSPHWNGTPADLSALLGQYQLTHPFTLPIRDAIDFVHTCIASTIKALKFSNLSQICGGPIEISVITADRPFRWVLHKSWDSAMREGMP